MERLNASIHRKLHQLHMQGAAAVARSRKEKAARAELWLQVVEEEVTLMSWATLPLYQINGL